MLRKQPKRRSGLDFKDGDRRTCIGLLTMFERATQFVVIDERAAADLAEPKTFVDPHQGGRGIDVDAQTSRLKDRPQIRNRRPLAIGAGDVNDRRQSALGMVEPFQQPMHPRKIEVDALGMQRRQPRDQFIERRRSSGRGRVHAWGAAGTTSGLDTIWAGIVTCGAGFEMASSAGDFVSNRQSRANVGRRSWRCTTMSTMPWSFRYSARLKPSGNFSRMVCSITRAPAKPISAPGSAICTSPSIA